LRDVSERVISADSHVTRSDGAAHGGRGSGAKPGCGFIVKARRWVVEGWINHCRRLDATKKSH
jgi:hypothetical protein